MKKAFVFLLPAVTATQAIAHESATPHTHGFWEAVVAVLLLLVTVFLINKVLRK